MPGCNRPSHAESKHVRIFRSTTKAQVAYGEAIIKDLSKVIDMLGEANGLLERCMKTMDVSAPRALLWQNISKVKSFIADGMTK